MSWENLLRRVLRPIGPLQPHNTSEYGAIRKRGTSPHTGIDANYNVGPNGQTGINLQHPALRAPVDGIATNAGEGNVGRIAIRDANGLSHEILHTHSRHVRRGDPVAAGQLIGTMGNTGVLSDRVESGDHHVHFQIKDSAGKPINPKAYWHQQGHVDPDPALPAFIDQHQRYLRRFDELAGRPAAAPKSGNAPAPFGSGGQFVPGSATSSRPRYETRSFIAPPEEPAPVDTTKNIRRLVRLPIRMKYLAGFDPSAPAPLPNEIPPADRPASRGLVNRGHQSLTPARRRFDTFREVLLLIVRMRSMIASATGRPLQLALRRAIQTYLNFARAWKTARDRHRPASASVDHSAPYLRLFGSAVRR